jgi:hypothetical protein
MPKAKTNWKQVHKIQVHHNRWLAWTIAIAVLACASLVAYIQVTDIHFSTQMSFSSGAGTSWSSFNHRSMGYSIKYPKIWGLETEADSGMAFVNPNDVNEYFAIASYPLEEERELRAALFKTNELPVKIGGLSGTKVNQGGDQAESIAMVKNDQAVFVLRGKGGNFDRILATFRFNQRLE